MENDRDQSVLIPNALGEVLTPSAVKVFLFGRHEGWSQFWVILFIAIFPSALLWFFWRGLLMMLATSPGALLWRELRNARGQGGS